MFFALAEILRAKKLRQADYLRAFLRRLADFLARATKVLVRIRRAGHLDQADGKGFRIQECFSFLIILQILFKSCHSEPLQR
jgi:hypothetical protein